MADEEIHKRGWRGNLWPWPLRLYAAELYGTIAAMASPFKSVPATFMAKLRARLTGAPFEFILIPFVLFGAVMAFRGFEEVLKVPFGRLPRTPEGWFVTLLLVAFSSYFANYMKKEVHGLRDESYVVPANLASVWISFAVGAMATLFAWRSSRLDDPILQPLMVGMAAFLLFFLIVALPWRASVEMKWTRANAHALAHDWFVVEGSDDRKVWHRVARVDQEGLIGARLTAHKEFGSVRVWQARSFVSLLESHAARDFVLSERLAAVQLSEDEMRKALAD